MFFTTRRLMAAIPRAIPTPSTAPTRVWVVEMGRPVPDATTTVACRGKATAGRQLCDALADDRHDADPIGSESGDNADRPYYQDPQR